MRANIFNYLQKWALLFPLALLSVLESKITSAANPVLVGFSCQQSLEILNRPVPPPGHFVLIETPRLILTTSEQPDFGELKIIVMERIAGLQVGVLYYNQGGRHLPLRFEPWAKGLGFATEAKFALMKYVFDLSPHEIDSIEASIKHGNHPSINLHQKLGFRLLNEDKLSGKTGEVLKFAVEKAQFKALEETLAREHEGDLTLFAKPRGHHSTNSLLIYEYLQMMFDEDELQDSTGNPSPQMISWVQRFLEKRSRARRSILTRTPDFMKEDLLYQIEAILNSEEPPHTPLSPEMTRLFREVSSQFSGKPL